jgi:hypothetical protein
MPNLSKLYQKKGLKSSTSYGLAFSQSNATYTSLIKQYDQYNDSTERICPQVIHLLVTIPSLSQYG